MKKILLAIICFIFALNVKAQAVYDSVTMDTGYANEVFYQLSTQTKTTVPFSGISGWDIGFQTTLMNASIICDDNSILVYAVPGVDSTDYATLDVSGYAAWTELYNSDTTWDLGAFNTGENLAAFNFGWGVYDFNTHEVYGNSLFAVVRGSDVYKFWIRRKTSTGDYLIRYTNVTAGGSDVDVTIPAAGYNTKNFVYLNLDNPVTLDLEPAATDWDILFTRYFTYIPYPGIYYPVTGVFSNSGVTVAKAYPVDVNTVSYTNYLSDLSTNLSEIGYDWKTFIQPYGPYVIEDSLVYFIKAKDNSIYNLQFTGFNFTTGTSDFITTKLLTGIGEVEGAISQAGIYPNPSSDYASIVYDAKTDAEMTAQLFDISGKRVMQTSFEAHQGLNHQTLSFPRLSSGLYHLMLNTGNQNISLKMMVTQ